MFRRITYNRGGTSDTTPPRFQTTKAVDGSWWTSKAVDASRCRSNMIFARIVSRKQIQQWNQTQDRKYKRSYHEAKHEIQYTMIMISSSSLIRYRGANLIRGISRGSGYVQLLVYPHPVGIPTVKYPSRALGSPRGALRTRSNTKIVNQNR